MKLEKNVNQEKRFLWVLVMGILLRFWMMAFGHNFDFDSYCIVGDLVVSGKSVYANTARYNYGPFFFLIQGLCYWLGQLAQDPVLLFRMLLLSVLTAADVWMAIFLLRRHGLAAAAAFFLSPVSIIITGYNNQFDNLAVLPMLASLAFYNREDDKLKNDVIFILLFSVSLIMKHIFAFLVIWLFVDEKLSWKRRFAYAAIPPVLFALSFVPSILADPGALNGIWYNVFDYRSTSNAPLLMPIYRLLGIENKYFTIFLLMMGASGVIFRKRSIQDKVLFYSCAMVAFSSAVADQYLAIPLVALAVFGKGWYWAYNVIAAYYLCTLSDCIPYSYRLYEPFVNVPVLGPILTFWVQNAFFLLCFLLFLKLLVEGIKDVKNGALRFDLKPFKKA